MKFTGLKTYILILDVKQRIQLLMLSDQSAIQKVFSCCTCESVDVKAKLSLEEVAAFSYSPESVFFQKAKLPFWRTWQHKKGVFVKQI
ncbi:hypothetical protein BRARA_H01973 [Brassica rapa]|uniref:Uncharacterized protein n=1 Tax=Brassica campestris TaxID=3711 RepID=A0A397YCU3_BRACM|nr:hypothetical protein BRARA_H01973 [Brassica rapa]